MIEMLERHESAYDESIKFMLNPPRDLKIVEIAPDAPLESSIFGSAAEAMMADYNNGCRAGESALNELHKRQP